MSTLHKLEWEHRARVTDCLRRYPPLVSELTFTNLFVWRPSRPVWFLEAADGLIFFGGTTGSMEPHYVLGDPVGVLVETALAVVRRCVPGVTAWERISEDVVRELNRLGGRVDTDEDNSDYVYRVADLAELKGERYHKKRNLVAQCLAEHDCRYEPITPANSVECMTMQDRWCAARQCGLNPGLCHEYDAIRELFAHAAELPLLGGAIRVDGRIQAFAVGESLAPGVAVCHFEKAMPDVHGLGQLINQWFAQHALSGFEFENREQDLGVPGLRQAKQSYYPCHRVNKYRVRVEELASAVSGSVPDPRVCDRRPGLPIEG